jgi:hypothetical protein
MPNTEALAAQIIAAPFSRADVERAKKYLEGFPYTTTALQVLALVIRDAQDDASGAELVEHLIEVYAEHEAEQL